MSGSMQAPSCSRRIWLAFAVGRGKGGGGAKAKPVSTHRWRAGEHGHGKWRVHRDRSLPWQARGGWVRRRLGRAGTKEETAMKSSMGIDHITLCVKNLGAAEYLFTKILGFDVIWSARGLGRDISSKGTLVVLRRDATIEVMQ